MQIVDCTDEEQRNPPGERVGIVEEGGLRLDRALVGLFPDLSRARLQDLVREGFVTRDGAVTRDPSAKVPAGTRLAVDVPPPSDPIPAAEAADLSIAYEDDDLIVIDKRRASWCILHRAMPAAPW